MGRRRVIREARCRKCGDTFVPADENDLEHFVRTSNDEHEGEPCGGAGVIIGSYYTLAEAAAAIGAELEAKRRRAH
jgi:uncharacterized OB-fold protein